MTGAISSGSCSARSSPPVTYDLRRLRADAPITRKPHSNRYQVTDTGLEPALFLTRAHDRLLRTGLAEPEPRALRTVSRAHQKAIAASTQG